ncbi:MAG: anaerobic sulfatase maturase [Candidatus Hydrogenedentes bacterium]|nr:anaerobic sulfatase maturase [Candidatus Hydrogenedentota bacterium]
MKQQRPFHLLAKPSGPLCNLECKYCFYLEKEQYYAAPSRRMTPEVLDTFVRQYIEAQDGPEIHFAWQGGEPTLAGVDFFREAVGLQQRYAGGKRITNAFQTNGILLNDGWGEFLAANDFLVGISIDGPEHLHDSYRVDRGGHGTFKRVLRGLGYLKKHGVEFNTLTVVNRRNGRCAGEVYEFLRETGSGFMQFIPLVERLPTSGTASNRLIGPHDTASARVTAWSVAARDYGRFLCEVFDRWVRRDVGKVFVQAFDVFLAAWLGMEPPLCVYRKTCGDALVVEQNGDIYSCDHFVYPEYRLGNLSEQPLRALVDSTAQRQFGAAKEASLPGECLECIWRFACNGGCPKHRFLSSKHGEPGLNYFCEGYKAFFSHADRHLQQMALALRQGRPATTIMAQVWQEDHGGQTPPQRASNAPCPCGSGRKYKKCCGAVAQPRDQRR